MLPKWVISNEASIAREAEDFVAMTPAERAELLAVLCSDAVLLLDARPDSERVLAFRDPMPRSSVVIMDRLRKLHREGAA